jgi:PAS domain
LEWCSQGREPTAPWDCAKLKAPAYHFCPKRSLGHSCRHATQPELEGLITEVIDQVQPREVEVRDQHGVWYLLRIHPYRITENKIDGAVLVLLDINQIKVFQQVQQEIEERLHLALEGRYLVSRSH